MDLTTRYNTVIAAQDKAVATKPGPFFEVAYFLAFLYLRVLPTFGIYAGSATAGLFMVAIAGLVVLTQIRSKRAVSVSLSAIAFPVAISASMWFIVLGTHPEFWQQSNYFFISTLPIWVSEVMIVSYLIARPGFIKRLLLLMFGTALVVLSFAHFDADRRLNLTTSGFLANSNDFAAWAAFCALCFAMWAFSARRLVQKLLLILMSFVSFALVAYTISRASMFLGLGALALYVLARSIILKRGISTMITLVTGLIVLGMVGSYFNLDGIVTNYSQRLTEETGRDRLWSKALPLVLDNPLGIGTLYIYDPILKRYIGPHNVFLYFGLAAGWIPIILTFSYYLVAAKRMRKRDLYDGFLWIPSLFLFMFLEHNQSNEYIFHLWSVITLCLCMMPRDVSQIPNPVKTPPRLRGYPPSGDRKPGPTAVP